MVETTHAHRGRKGKHIAMKTIAQEEFDCKGLLDKFANTLQTLVTRTADPVELADLDTFARTAFLQLGDEALAGVLGHAAAQLRARGDMPACPKCGDCMQFKQNRAIQVQTALTGVPLKVPSPMAVCSKCSVGASLLRKAMGLDADGRTRRLRHVATIAGTVEPYQAAAENLLAEIAGITASANGIHSICQDAGAVAEALMATGAHSPARKLAPGEVLYVMADGCMVWIGDGWHEVKFAVIFPDLANVEVSKDRRETTTRTVVATTGDREDLGAMVWAAVERWLPKDVDGAPKPKDRIVFISDGAPWLTNMVDEHLPGAMVLLDWYHMAEHLAATAKVLHPQDELAARRWRKHHEALLMDGRVEGMLLELARQRTLAPLAEPCRQVLGDLHSYLDKRPTHLDYCAARAMGLLIGSGPVESAANHVVQQRMKRSGMRWEAPGASAMLALRAVWRTTGGFAQLAAAA